MKLGFVTAILDSWTYEEMMDFASEQGFECVEVACWPQEKAERRYAGVSHIDAIVTVWNLNGSVLALFFYRIKIHNIRLRKINISGKINKIIE